MKTAIATLAGATLIGSAFIVFGKPEKAPEPAQESYFAEIAADGTVLRVIVADQAFIDSGAVGDPKKWVQTYQDGRRANYAGVGFKYDKQTDRFEQPDPKDGSLFDATKGRWKLVPKPNVGTTTLP